jgi:hypothetical protein
VTLGGSILFLLFGIIYLYEAYRMGSDIDVPGGDTVSREIIHEA